MGFATGRFVNPVDPNLVCGVCGGVMEAAVATPCGHCFCRLCLHTWLQATPGLSAALTCPECRSPVPSSDAVKPVHSLRNLILGMEVQCQHRERGCKVVVKLDGLQLHADTCAFGPVDCAGCGVQVSRLDLPGHHMTCVGIAASVHDVHDELVGGGRRTGGENDDDEEEGENEEERFSAAWREFRERLQTSKHGASSTDVCILLSRIQALESRVERLLEELRVARAKTLTLEREYDKVHHHHHAAATRLLRGGDNNNNNNNNKHNNSVGVTTGCVTAAASAARDLQDTEFFLEHECARTPETLARLSLLIARNLLQKPRYLESEQVFGAVRRCYEKFVRTGRCDCEHDLHMLLATAYACNWFNACQRLTLKCWLQALVRPVARSGSSLFNR